MAKAAWTLPVLQIDPPKNPGALADVIPLLDRLVSAFGTRPLARLLGVEPGTVTNWTSHRRKLSEESAKRIMDLHDVLTRALQVFQPRTAMDWLVGNEPYLDHARPIDVLVSRGSAPLIEALRGIDSGGYP
jgi:putative toxin-antitoxin system antitoxin component (TIGR02293 family)